MQFLAIPVLLFCLIEPTCLQRTASAEERLPNIVILYADDLGYGDLGCYNQSSKIPTPNLDRLAKSGMRFTDSHSSSGICTPSRYALLTGRYHWRDFHGIVGPFGKSVFKSERLTLPEMLKDQGYHTAAIGKWHLGWDWDAMRIPEKRFIEGNSAGNNKGNNNRFDAFDWSKPIPDGPLAHGFDYYFGDTVINFPPYCWIENDRVVDAPDTMMKTSKWKKIKEGNWECRPGPMHSSWDPYQNIPSTTAKGVEYIKSQASSEKPFFLYFAYPSPHAPIIPNDRFDGKSKAGAYGDFVVETDDSIGQLLRALEESGQAGHTVVIFSADNGPEHYAYARDEKFDHWSAEPLRGLKRDIYEGGHRVPMIIRYPNVTRPGSISNHLISQIDLMATIAAITGATLPSSHAAEDSLSQLPILKGANKPVRRTLVHNTREGQYAIRHQNWLLINTKTGYVTRKNAKWEKRREYVNDDNGATELYDLSKDPGQKQNVSNSSAAIVLKLQGLLREIRVAKKSSQE